MLHKKKWILTALLAVIVETAFADCPQVPETPHKNSLYASPIMMAIGSGTLGFPVISLTYERSLTEKGLALLIPIHGGYSEDTHQTQDAFGMGLGIRKYIGRTFSGSYLNLQSDYLRSEKFGENPLYNPPNNEPVWTKFSESNFLSVTQLSFGYKWTWGLVNLDLGLGGAFYAQKDQKYTNFIGAANIGFPFSKETFGF